MFTDATESANCVAADMQLFDVMTRAFLIKNGMNRIAAFTWMWLESHANLKVAGKAMMEIGPQNQKKGRFRWRLDSLDHFGNKARHCFVESRRGTSEAIGR